jgi:TRAP-type uncharacterized transport system fused permease subunit
MSKQAASKPATVSRRELSGKEMLTVRILGAVLAIAALADALDIYRTMGMELFKEQKLATYLGISLAVAFLLKPFKGKVKTHVPWYDWLLATISLACCIFVAVEYERIFEQIYEEPLDALIVGGVILLLLIDALRRTTGPVLAIFLTVFLVIGAASHLFPGQMQGRQVPWTEYTLYLAMDSNALLSIPLTVVSTIVITFIFFGKLLDSSHGSKFFTDISMSLMGRYRGGWYFTIPFVLIIVGLFVWNLQPHAAAMIAAGSLLPIGLLLGYNRERMRFKAIYQAFEQTGLRVTVLLLISSI